MLSRHFVHTSHIKTFRQFLLAGITATLLTLFLTIPAIAGDQDFVMRYTAEDLENPNKATALYSRIVSAARLHCGDPGRKTLSQRRFERDCFTLLVERAVQQIDNGFLSAVHAKQQDELRIAKR